MELNAEKFKELLSVKNMTATSAYSDALDYDEQLAHYEAIVKLTIALNKVISNHNELIDLYNELNGRFNGATFTVGTGDITTEKIADGGVTVDKLAGEVITEMRKISAEYVGPSETFLRDGLRGNPGPMISFIDDDCRTAAYDVLFKEVLTTVDEDGKRSPLKIPYAFACPHENLGGSKYMRHEDLMEMYNAGADITCHTHREYNMDQFETEDDFVAMLENCMEAYKSWGVNDVTGYCYCQGKWEAKYMNAVKKFFKLGFTVDPGINTVPIESYYMKRVEVFIKNDKDGNPAPREEVLDRIENVVKPYIDQVAREGGWLILMTHAWYGSFDEELLKEIIEYIQAPERNIPIVSIDDAVKKVGNVIETGIFRKPLIDSTNPYFVVDANGKAWANQLDTGTDNVAGTVVPLTIRSGYTLCSTLRSSNPPFSSKDSGYIISEPVDVTDCAKVLVSGYAYYDESITAPRDIFCFLDATGKVQNKEGWSYGGERTYADGGTTLYRYEAEVPAGAKTIIVAGYRSGGKEPGLVKVEKSNEDLRLMIGDMTTLKTSHKATIVGAINELYNMITGNADPEYPGATITLVDTPVFEDTYGDNPYGVDLRLGGDPNSNAWGKPIGYTQGQTNGYPSRVSVYMSVDPDADFYLFTCSARYGHGLYSFFRQDGTVINCVSSQDEAGTSLEKVRVDIPEGAAYYYVAANLGIAPDGFAVYACTGMT